MVILIKPLLESSVAIDMMEIVKNSSFTVNMILLGLFLTSVACWGIIVMKFIQYRKAVITTQQFVNIFWKNFDYQDVFRKSELLQDSPVASIFRAGYNEFEDTKKEWEKKGKELTGSKVDEVIANVERAMKREGQTKLSLLENFLSVLATTATATPFIGLFGTVWGIMNAFHEIGKTGSATLGTIAPSLSEALVTTAFGLAAAIPAAIFFNYFNSKLQLLEREGTNIISDFLNFIKRSFV